MDEAKTCAVCRFCWLPDAYDGQTSCPRCFPRFRREIVSGGHPGYLKLLDELKELHVRKAADYGRGADPFANVRASAEFGIPAWVGVMVRANDKVHRIKSFVQNGSLKNESVEDSLKDLAAYALIALVLYREEQANQQEAHLAGTHC